MSCFREHEAEQETQHKVPKTETEVHLPSVDQANTFPHEFYIAVTKHIFITRSINIEYRN